MKKFLSLVLALVMTMSLVTVSAGAKDFTDDSEITYKEAVDVISALGVVDGYSDGDFRPDDVLTRGAAAKIICNLILGPTTASALSAGTAPFKDVPVTNTFAGYITYCSQQGIISGYADGTFRPTGTLSGNAFMKMLLGALGYDSSIEGYTGANWSINVAKQAISIGLNDGLKGEFNGVKAVSAQIFDEGGLILDVGFIDAQLFSNNLLDTGFDIFFHLNLRDQIKNFCDVERFGTFLIDTRFHAGSIILIIAELYKTSGKNFQRG